MKVLKYIIIFLVSYIIGVLFPLPCFERIMFNDNSMSKGDYYCVIINFFVAFGTCATVVVALFMDEIKSHFKKVTFDIQLSGDIEEETENVKSNIKAKRYHIHINFFNKGNINAHNCELYLENAEYKNAKSVNSTLTIEHDPISWNNNNLNVYIPCNGKKVLLLFEIYPPQQKSTPSGEINKVPAPINFLGLKNLEGTNGVWELTYCLYSTNSKPKRFKCIVNWNGVWQDRKAEMKDVLKIKLEML